MTTNRPRRRPLHGYGPLLAAAGSFLLMVALVPSRSPVASGGAAGPGPVTANQVATGADQVKPCGEARKVQVANDPYSPPCLEWTGTDNGGETSSGVSGDTIVVTYRTSEDIADVGAGIGGNAPIGAGQVTTAGVNRTMDGMAEYFNRNFQFYGRKIKLMPFKASGSPLQELTGAGQQQAEADAVNAAKELGAFADVSGTPTGPYASALASKKVISMQAPSPSDQFFVDRRPYVWSHLPSCTTSARAASEMMAKTLVGKPARYAGDPKFQGVTRKIAILTPEGQEYQNCSNTSRDALRAAGADPLLLSYPLDFGNMTKAAEGLATKLVAEGITTVACACDPLLPANLTASATKSGYRPEWVVMGYYLSDSDLFSQGFDQSQWAHTLGITVMGNPPPAAQSPAKLAFKSVFPDEEPLPIIDDAYYQLYMLAIGIQMAGPQLTPESFERGMFAYPEHVGPSGGWRFEAGKYTPQSTAWMLWWDPEAVSPINGLKGTYRRVGDQYPIGQAPTGDPEMFKR